MIGFCDFCSGGVYKADGWASTTVRQGSGFHTSKNGDVYVGKLFTFVYCLFGVIS